MTQSFGSINEISVVIPVYNDAELLEEALTRVVGLLDDKGLNWELIIVDDCSQDESQRCLMNLACLKRANVKIFRMVRNFGQHVALFAGLSHATKEWRLTFDVDYVSAFGHIDQVLAQAALGGQDLVSISRRGQRSLSPFRHAGTRFLNALTNRATGKPMRDPLSPVKLVHKSLVEQGEHYGELRRFLAPLAIRLAGNPGEISIPLPRKRGKSHYGLFRLIGLTLDFVLNFFPGLITRLLVVSALTAVLSGLAGLAYVILRILGSIDASTHAQVLILIFLGLSINGVTLGIIGEYHVRLYQIVQSREYFEWEEIQ